MDHFKRFREAPTAPVEQVDFGAEDADVLQIARMVQKRKGSWWQLPKDLKPKA